MKVQHVLAGLPFAGILAGVFFANSVEPYVLGLPFATWTSSSGPRAAAGSGRSAPEREPVAEEAPRFTREPVTARGGARQA